MGDPAMDDLMLCVEPMVPALRRYARALLHDRDAADDLVQDCLERVIGRWQQRREARDTRQWVFAILHNLAISRLRERQRRGEHVPLEDVDEGLLSIRPRQEDGLGMEDLQRALQALPHEQRSVLLLVSLEDMSYAEVARTLDIPVGTVMSRLSRAREKMLRLMEGGLQSGRPSLLRRVK